MVTLMINTYISSEVIWNKLLDFIRKLDKNLNMVTYYLSLARLLAATASTNIIGTANVFV